MPSPLYLAAGFNGLVAHSTDGKNWTEANTGNARHRLFSGVFGSGSIVLCGGAQKNLSLHSRTGKRWEESDVSALPQELMAVATHKDQFVGFGGDAVTIGNAKAYAATSPDGKKWTLVATVGDGRRNPRAAVSDGNRVVLVGDRGLKAVSTDLKSWDVAEDQRAADTLGCLAFGAGVFVGGGLHGLRMHSSDGRKWSRVEGEEGEHINSMLWTGKEFVGVGLGATYRSPDGVKWTRTSNTNAPLDAAHGPGGFVGCRWKGRVVHSTDAVTWTEVAKFESHPNKLLFGQI